MTAESHCQRGDQLARQNQMLAAIAEFRAAIRLDPNYPLAHFYLATALRIIGQLEQATESYRKAVELQPNYSQAWEKLAEVLTDRRQFAQAVQANQHAARGRRRARTASVWRVADRPLSAHGRQVR